MGIKRVFHGIAVLTLGALLLSGGSSHAQTLELTKVEIRDPMMNNAVAARVALPSGWVIKERHVPWSLDLYGDPARVVFGLQGPADEVEFAAISRLQFNFDQSWLAMADYMHNEMIRMADEQCQTAWRFTPGIAQQLCMQANASMQPELQKIQQRKAALLSGQAVDNGLTVRQPMWAADIAQWLLRENREISDVRIIKIERPADLEAMLRKAVVEQDAQVRQMAVQLNLPFKGLSFDVARVFFSYTKDGKGYDGVSLVIARYCTFVSNQQIVRLSAQSGPDPLYGKEFVVWSVHINSATALAGKLQAHESELAAIVANSAVDPVWQAAVDKFAEEITRKVTEARQKKQLEMWEREMAHQEKMQQMRNETFNYVSKSRQEVFERRSEALSNAATGWTDALTDRQRWQGSGDKYVAPNDYDYAWERSDGKTVFSNDSSFNPNHSSDYSGDWKEMSKAPW